MERARPALWSHRPHGGGGATPRPGLRIGRARPVAAVPRGQAAGAHIPHGRPRGLTATPSRPSPGGLDLMVRDELHLLLYPLTLGSGKRVLPSGLHATFGLTSATPYPSGEISLHYARQRATT